MLLARQATKGRQTLAFYSLPEYEAWKEAAGPGWSIKYYKGLGTSTEAEAKEYFAAIDSHRKAFVWEGARAHSLGRAATLACLYGTSMLGRPGRQAV